jgi:hypothetical protein
MIMETNTPVVSTEIKKKTNDFKVIPVFEATRERLKNNMMKVDTYDSYINKQLDRLIALEAEMAIINQNRHSDAQVK